MADEHKCMVWIGTGTPGVLECAECRQKVTILSEPPADLRAAAVLRVVEAWRPKLGTVASIKAFVADLDAALSGDRPSPAECGCPCNCHADEGKPEWPGSCEACCNVEWGPLCECSRRLAAQLLKERTVGDRPSPEADPLPDGPVLEQGTPHRHVPTLMGRCSKCAALATPSPEADPCPRCGVHPRLPWEASPATAPAEGLDVERLALAITNIDFASDLPASGIRAVGPTIARKARLYAAEYARLAPDSAQGPHAHVKMLGGRLIHTHPYGDGHAETDEYEAHPERAQDSAQEEADG